MTSRSALPIAASRSLLSRTMSSVAKHMPRFVYNPAIGSFKTWLLNMTRWRIADQMRKRVPVAEFSVRTGDSTAGIDGNPVNHLADPARSSRIRRLHSALPSTNVSFHSCGRPH